MSLTQGQLYFYGGIILAGVSVLLMIISIIVLEARKKKMLKQLEE